MTNPCRASGAARKPSGYVSPLFPRRSELLCRRAFPLATDAFAIANRPELSQRARQMGAHGMPSVPITTT